MRGEVGSLADEEAGVRGGWPAAFVTGQVRGHVDVVGVGIVVDALDEALELVEADVVAALLHHVEHCTCLGV